MLSNEHILDAAVIVYHHHYFTHERPLRPLVRADFEWIRKLRSEFAEQWRKEKSRSATKIDYNEWRKAKLQELAKKHHWHPSTINLYASIHSTLINWHRNGVPAADRKILNETRAGVRLWAQFLTESNKALL